ncbi:MAG: pitrilysin family protein [Brevundimonas sp.]|nr:pitrilysin family protein [Brevundimonas sp.]
MPGLQTVAVCVAIATGARHESPEHSGWSHFLEHMVFKGAGDMSAREIVERIEAGGGSINASTGYERTVFEVRAMADGLETALQVISDLIFHPVFDPDEVEREKDVVAQEIAEAFDTPDDHVFEMAQARAFEGQPLGRAILGQVETLAPIDRDAIRAFRADMYRPDRIVVSVSGAVDEAQLLALVERGFSEGVARAASTVPAGHFVGGEARLARRIEQSNLVFLLPGLSHTDPRRPALRLGVEILGGGMASRLFQTAREERGLAYAIDAYHESYADCGLLGIYAGSAADRAAELAQVCGETIRMLVTDGPTGRELDRARAVARAGIRMADESPVARAGRLATQSLIFGHPVSSDAMVDEVMSQSREDVQQALATCLAPGLTATAVLGPKAGLSAGLLFERALTG